MIAEILAFAGGAGGGAMIKLASNMLDNYHKAVTAEREYNLAREEQKEKAAVSARKFAESFNGGAWARRFIVITVFAYLFVFPFAAAIMGMDINYAYTKDGGGIFHWMFGWGADTKFITMSGFTMFQAQMVLASHIAGFYFGAGVVKR